MMKNLNLEKVSKIQMRRTRERDENVDIFRQGNVISALNLQRQAKKPIVCKQWKLMTTAPAIHHIHYNF